MPEDGAASGVYNRAVEKLSLSLARTNAAIIELHSEDAALVRCALESAKLYFRSRSHTASLWNSSDWLKLSGYLAAPARDMYFYRAGRFWLFQISKCKVERNSCMDKMQMDHNSHLYSSQIVSPDWHSVAGIPLQMAQPGIRLIITQFCFALFWMAKITDKTTLWEFVNCHVDMASSFSRKCWARKNPWHAELLWWYNMVLNMKGNPGMI